MLSANDNELLTRTGAGTPMGDLFRRFWAPVLIATELPEPDCPPVRVGVLGEELVAFRDTTGAVGLIEGRCPHRGAGLYWGRNEECGLRCIYHGWKFDVNGNCLDMPSEPPESQFREKVGVAAYPTREWGGYIWAYMGPPELPLPELPQFEWAHVPESHRYVSKKLQECNWAQSVEGAIDTAHFSFLHMLVDLPPDAPAALRYMKADGSPKFTLQPTEGGFVIGGARFGPRKTASTGASRSSSRPTTASPPGRSAARTSTARPGCRSTTRAAGSTPTPGTPTGPSRRRSWPSSRVARPAFTPSSMSSTGPSATAPTTT